MAWESRGGRGHYYTRSKRVGGRIVRQYFGSGVAGELAATEDALRKVERQIDLQRCRQDQERHDALAGSIEVLSALSDLLVRAVLIGLNYHKHGGQWRHRQHVHDDNAADT
jgi:hypothetical protein